MEYFDTNIGKKKGEDKFPFMGSQPCNLAEHTIGNSQSGSRHAFKKPFPRGGSLFARIIYCFAMWVQMKMELCGGGHN